MTEKLILRAENKKDKEYNPVFISSDTHQKLKQLSKSTGIPMRSLADKMFNFALENSTIINSDDGSNPE
ncbi:hypothetical protein ACWN56_05310 [Weissella viridescens]|uniref:Uncharacterized protein n=1 Tax=Weissella viridescens TaxID=1629 RepID=A0A0R2H7T1_WEIVI|nr:hypothetical protein [Weissella viridescens]KRN46188.1 hypothetical protein IV50_GL001164 [Weissella viridescens]